MTNLSYLGGNVSENGRVEVRRRIQAGENVSKQHRGSHDG